MVENVDDRHPVERLVVVRDMFAVIGSGGDGRMRSKHHVDALEPELRPHRHDSLGDGAVTATDIEHRLSTVEFAGEMLRKHAYPSPEHGCVVNAVQQLLLQP